MGKTSIEWTDASWNPIVGCTEVSPGCAHCYAARLAATRLRETPAYKGLAGRGVMESGPWWTGEVRFLSERLEEPLHWKKPRRIFVCDMGDLFHEEVEHHWLVALFSVMWRCQQHTFQILTKRPKRMQEWFTKYRNGIGPNVWAGVSVENGHFAEERIPLLLATPARVRWISAEPLLSPVDIYRWLRCGVAAPDGSGLFPGTTPKLDWVVCGGESGANARPMHPEWARKLRDQCKGAGVPFFFKQWGEWRAATDANDALGLAGKYACKTVGEDPLLLWKLGKKKAGRLLDGRTWDEFPA